MAQQIYCVKVVSTFLKGGVPLNNLENFMHFVSRIDTICMIVFLSYLKKKNRLFIKKLLENVSVIFDGTSRLGEALATI